MNKTSQALLVPLAFALLTIAIMIIAEIRTTAKYTKEPKPNPWAAISATALTPPNIDKTIPAMAKMSIIQLKILAMLYITADALCITRNLPSEIIIKLL